MNLNKNQFNKDLSSEEDTVASPSSKKKVVVEDTVIHAGKSDKPASDASIMMNANTSVSTVNQREIKYYKLYGEYREQLAKFNDPAIHELMRQVEPVDEEEVFKDLLKEKLRYCRQEFIPCDELEYIKNYPEDYKDLIKDVFAVGLEFGDGLVGSGYIGAGGMGEVYLARPKFANVGKVKRAIKVARKEQLHEIFNERSKYMRQTFADFEKEVQSRFLREIEISTFLESVHHPKKDQIVKCYSSGMTANEELFLVMEYIDGYSLVEMNDLFREKAGRALPYQAVCAMIYEVAQTLDFLHEYIVHRDIKPQNIMYSRKDRKLKILDFGISKFTKDMPTEESSNEFPVNITIQGLGGYKGTPSYSPLEQFFDASNVDHRSDIFSLGCTFFELLDEQGQSPYRYEARTGGNLVNNLINERTVKPIPEIKNDECPAALKKIIYKMLAQTPQERQANARVLAEELVPFKDDDYLELTFQYIEGKIAELPAPKRTKTVESKQEQTENKGLFKWLFRK